MCAQGLVHGSPPQGRSSPAFQPWVLLGPRRPFSQPCTPPGAAATGLICKPGAHTGKLLGRWMRREIGEEEDGGSACACLRVSLGAAVCVCAGAAVGDTARPPCISQAAGKEQSLPARGEAGGRGHPAARARPATGGQYVPVAGRFTCSGRRPLTVPDSLQHLLPQR